MAKTNTAVKPKHNSQAKQPEQSEPQPIPEEPEIPTSVEIIEPESAPITQSAIQPVGDVVAPPTTDSVTTESIIHLSHVELFPFKNHPFQLRDDEDMKALVASVKERGIDQPAIVRPRDDGGYSFQFVRQRKQQ
jgi:hypothetical protein